MLTLTVAATAAAGAYAMLGVSIVVLYRMAGVVNFSVAVVGAFGAYTTAAAFGQGWPFGAAMVVGIALAAALAMLTGLIFARFFATADSAARTAAMIAATVGLFAVGFRIFGDAPRSVPVLFPGVSWSAGNVVVTLSSIIVIGAAILTVLLMRWVLARTRLGTQVRAMSERPVTAELLGVPIYARTTTVWGFTGAVSAFGMIVVASNLPGGFSSLGFLIFPAMAAALIGAFRSLPLAFAGGLVVAIIESLSSYRPSWAEYRGAVPFLIALVVLLWTQRKQVWDAAR
ncbi:MAG: branched-chain amino acid ABC transporter permease [bacterium]|nr:branched-chain amino acid ABC transporter permease [bacterium]